MGGCFKTATNETNSALADLQSLTEFAPNNVLEPKTFIQHLQIILLGRCLDSLLFWRDERALWCPLSGSSQDRL